MDLYRGQLLAGFSLADNSEFESWAALERATFERLYLQALEALIQARAVTGDYQAAIVHAERYLETDELAESMYRRLMLFHALTGDRAAALRQYERCAVVLEREFNVSPLPETRRVYQAVLEGRSPAELAALLAGPEVPGPQATGGIRLPATNLPAQVTSFVGREREVREVRRLLSTTRLLTLVGAGGSGKTRLALEIAAGLVDACEHGVWWVELASLSDPALVPQAVASILKVREQPGRTLVDTLSDHLRSRDALLLLDNCEHLVAACARLVDTLLHSCPRLRIVATSREALGIAGETAWPVPVLSLPEPGQPPAKDFVSTLNQSEAVRLFVERAAAVQPGFALTEQNAAAVVQVCRRLDGLPLAIELAAARVRVLTAEQMAGRLEASFQLLTGGSRTALPRHQTLQAAIAWSYDLLSAQEQALLRRLSVFAGRWSIEAAEVVATDDGSRTTEGGRPPTLPSIDRHAKSPGRTCVPGTKRALVLRSDILDLLAQLVNKSLVVAEQQQAEARYRVLETIRQFAWERLAASGEAERTRSQHLDYFLMLAESAEPELVGPEQTAWLSRLEAEHNNLRAALEWSLEGGDAQAGLRLAGALWTFWDVHCHLTEGRAWLDGLLARTREPTRARARALGGAGRLAQRQGDYAPARALCEASVALYRELGDRKGLALALENLGWVITAQGAYAESRALLQESLRIGRELGDQDCIIYSLLSLGEVARMEGDDESAGALYGESLALAQAAGHQTAIAVLQHNAAYLALHQGDHERATALFTQALRLSLELGRQNGIAYNLLGFAVIARAREQPERAVRLFGAAKTLLDAIADAMDPAERAEYDRNLAAVRAGLDEAIFAAAWAEGQAMAAGGAQRAVAYALERDAPPEPRRMPAYASAAAHDPAGLTAREVEVLGLVARGLTDAQVAEKLVISPRTVSTHLTSIYRKLGVTTRGEAARFATANGLL